MRIRFIAKPYRKEGRKQIWNVYDVERGCFPYRTPELGVVAQEHTTEAAAQAEADRLQAKV